MTQSRTANPAFIEQVDIISNKPPRNTVSILGGIISFVYYESMLSDSLRATITFADTGAVENEKTNNTSVVEGLPIVGQEKVQIKFKDNNDNKIGDKPELILYVNSVKVIDNDTTRSLVQLDLVSREFILNEKTRITKRYDGKLSETVKKLLEDKNSIGLETEKDLFIEDTSNNFNFIGNNKKPFYVINWLARKSVSSTSQRLGKSAGYFFYERSDGYYFKSVDSLFSQEKKKSFIYTETTGVPKGYDANVLSFKKGNLIDAQKKLQIGSYSTRTILFDPFTTYYEVITPNAERNEEDLKLAGSNLPTLNPEFNQPGANKEFSRTTYYLLDKGTLASGDNQQQLEKKNEENFKYSQILNQSIMRLNQFFSSQATITIAGDFSLHIGDAIYLDLPKLGVDRGKELDKQDSGLYIIAELTHLVDTNGTFTRLNLVRDSFGKTGKANSEGILR